MNKAVLLLNLGTPAEPTAQGLREFYKYFFADPYVFDMSPLGRWLLRNMIILPFRAPKTAKLYEMIWMKEGSPLKVYADKLRHNLESALREQNTPVFNGMAYSKPFISDSMAEMEALGITDVLVLPLFPQYSTATTASVFHEVRAASKKWQVAPSLHFVNDLYAEPDFIGAWEALIRKHLDTQSVDHVIFSYHGLPEKNLTKQDQHGYCEFGDCCNSINETNKLCYRAQCFDTTRSIVKALDWRSEFYSIAFQSRFGRDPWIQPYLEEHIIELVKRGKKRIAVVTPSFVSDCLETIHEIGIEYKELFDEQGGDTFQLIPNLNDDQAWFDAVTNISKQKLASIG